MKNLTLVTGGARSGKSKFAEQRAIDSRSAVVYLATMPRLAGDQEQEARIAYHQQRRPESWTTIERPYNLSETIVSLPQLVGFCLIDCLSVYISNMLIGQVASSIDSDPYEHEAKVTKELDELLAAIAKQSRVQFCVVTNEVGWGIVPGNPLGRAFRDFLGVTNQRFAEAADQVYLTCSGLPLRLKPPASL